LELCLDQLSESNGITVDWRGWTIVDLSVMAYQSEVSNEFFESLVLFLRDFGLYIVKSGELYPQMDNTYSNCAECDWLLYDLEVVGKHPLVDNAREGICNVVAAAKEVS
jgi:hypothetical protein